MTERTPRSDRRATAGAALACLLAVTRRGGRGPAAGERRNWFDDPFIQVTAALPACPLPDPPLLTEEQMRREAHYRAERGTSCFQAGRCRLPNAYLYDREIAPRVVKAITVDGRFADTSVWIEGQRRWVWLKGCVARAEQKAGARTAGALDRRRRGGDRPVTGRHDRRAAAVSHGAGALKRHDQSRSVQPLSCTRQRA